MATLTLPRCQQCGGYLVMTDVFRCGDCGLPAKDVTAEKVRGFQRELAERERSELAPVMEVITFQPDYETPGEVMTAGAPEPPEVFEAAHAAVDLTPVEESPILKRRK